MTYQFSAIATDEDDLSVQVLGKTGGTIVHVFPNGKAQVQQGKKAGSSLQRHPSIQKQGSTTNASKPVRNRDISVKPPPPPPLRPDSIGFQSSSASTGNSLQSAAKNCKVQEKLGHCLLQKKLVTPTQLQVAQYDMTSSGMSLEDILVARGWVTQDAIAQFCR
ncbi:MAG: hypothetical protein AAGA75_12180 [Cyanobacteria bacterium P01_E01_bin.6]